MFANVWVECDYMIYAIKNKIKNACAEDKHWS